MDSDTLLALAARAEAGGDDALSDDVWRALGWFPSQDGGFNEGWSSQELVGSFHKFVAGYRPDLRVSLDAVEEVPGRIARVEFHQSSEFFADHWTAGSVCGQGWIGAEAPTECLARLAAKLKALAAQKESGGG